MMDTSGLLNYLLSFLTQERKDKFQAVARQRTRHICIVLEDIFQPHNASAVLRSCDCFGVQDVHIIENRNRFDVNPDVAVGASKWLSMHKYFQNEDNTTSCLQTLKDKGYLLVATSPHTRDYSLETLPLNQPLALMFGTELKGLSAKALAQADMQMYIPMAGFTESFNISVSVALSLYALTNRLKQSGMQWELTSGEMEAVLLDWARKSVRGSHKLEALFLAQKNAQTANDR
jgi:tRNA (guanosine-2'-O-)-methyltransferase